MRALFITITLLFFAGLLYQPEKGIAETGKHNRYSSKSPELHTGDIILRRGKGFISEMFRKSSQHDQQYSHAGIIQVTDQGVFVLHVLGESMSKKSNLLKEPISEFCNSNKNLAYAIYRYPFLSGKEAKINGYLNRLTSLRIQFDDQFDLSTDTALYCTELVYKMCLKVADTNLPLTILKEQHYVGLDNLYRNNIATLITKQTY